jgi:hypothetical protein
VKVQPAEMDDTRFRAPRSARLSHATFVVLSELYETLGDSPARQALKRLLAGETAGAPTSPPSPARRRAPAARPARKQARP